MSAPFGTPWKRGVFREIFNAEGESVAFCEDLRSDMTGHAPRDHAERIVQCVNACADFHDPAKEIAAWRAEYKAIRESNDRLAAEAKVARADRADMADAVRSAYEWIYHHSKKLKGQEYELEFRALHHRLSIAFVKAQQ